ncbi:MAG: DUF1573 domain-containing protein [Dysgonamonadaceae bacterium]|nr:DUF1573 domain-containing protein [Dysgonamonadaceae bacterium]
MQARHSLSHLLQSFEEISQLAAAENKHFAIVITDPACPPCEILHNKLFGDISFSVGNKAIFNIVDVTLPQNKWYQQFIASMAQPTTLLFSPEAKLKAIVQGASRTGTECIKNVIDGKLECVRYRNNLLFSDAITSEETMQALNLILTAKRKIKNKQDATTELAESMQTLYYPYPLWLQIQNEQNRGNVEDAVFFARQMLTFQEPWHAILYNDLFLESRQIIDPDFDITNIPILEVETNHIHLGDLQLNDKVDIRIKLKNIGKEILVIHDINISCSCLMLLSEKRYWIEADNEEYLFLQFTAEQQGEILRNVMITNNGIIPMQTITIRANVE